MNRQIDLTVLVTDESAVAEASAKDLSQVRTYKGAGWAKKHPNDAPDDVVGYSLAVARALRDLADNFESAAEMAMNNPLASVSMDGWTFGNWDGPVATSTTGVVNGFKA